MEGKTNTNTFFKEVGEIMMSDVGEIFWLVPEIFVCFHASSLVSPDFKNNKEIWRLVIMPSDGVAPVLENNKWIGLFLWQKSFNMPDKTYSVQLGIKTLDEDVICSHSGGLDDTYGFGKWNFFQISTMPYHHIESGRIKFFCIIQREEEYSTNYFLSSEIEDEDNESEDDTDDEQSNDSNAKGSESEDEDKIYDTDDEQSNDSNAKGIDRLVQNFLKLLDSECNTDVILKTNDHEFRAHSLILGARSPVFFSMFHHDMAEKKSGEVDISDCSTAGFKIFLKYLYTGSADSISPCNVTDLYYIADKYQVDDLKSDCVDHMMNNLSIDNFCAIIFLSVRHSELDLQNTATRFFCRNMKKIVKTVQWQKYITENPIQANELFIKGIKA